VIAKEPDGESQDAAEGLETASVSRWGGGWERDTDRLDSEDTGAGDCIVSTVPQLVRPPQSLHFFTGTQELPCRSPVLTDVPAFATFFLPLRLAFHVIVTCTGETTDWAHESDQSLSRRLTVHSQKQVQPLAPEIFDDQKQPHESDATEHREKQRVGPCERLLDAFLFVLCVLAQEGFGV
jgi:hypothetical protein